MAKSLRAALLDGLVDTGAIVGGGGVGLGLGHWFGQDLRTVIGLVLMLGGCAAGKLAASRWRARHSKPEA